jgi:hypothetical protein
MPPSIADTSAPHLVTLSVALARTHEITSSYDPFAPAYDAPALSPKLLAPVPIHAAAYVDGSSCSVDIVEGIAWHQLLRFVPFSETVCVAGSVGTWFAQNKFTGNPPAWSPRDIDVFIARKSQEEFAEIVMAVANSILQSSHACNCDSDDLLHNVMLASMSEKNRIINIILGDTSISLIRVSSDSAMYNVDTWVSRLLSDFDISVCKVSLHRLDGKYHIDFEDYVGRHIQSGRMTCVFKPSRTEWHRMYTLRVRAFKRLKKYESRGFKLCSLTFAVPYMTVNNFKCVFESDGVLD